jgi:hypothetical protein
VPEQLLDRSPLEASSYKMLNCSTVRTFRAIGKISVILYPSMTDSCTQLLQPAELAGCKHAGLKTVPL